MSLRRLFLGAVLGAGAMYLLDPDKGHERRRQALNLWAENKDQVLETARSTSMQVQAVSQQAATAAGKAADTAASKAAGTASKMTEALGDKASESGDGSAGQSGVDDPALKPPATSS
jgi:gas vesicle protein